MSRAWFWVPFLACALFVHFKNLGSTSLWQDEAETAVLARNTLREGVPKVFDGVNFVSQNFGKDHDEHGIWNYSPWLDIYLTAGSFALFGESNFSARLPFALASLLTLLLLYNVANRWTTDRRVAPLALWLNLLSVPYLLHARQCRYYVLDALFALYLFHAYEDLLASKKRGGLHLVLSSLGLFHANFLVFFAMTGGVLRHFAIFARNRVGVLRRHAIALGVLALALLPGILYFNILTRAGGDDPHWIAVRWMNFRYYLVEADIYLIPIILLPLVALERKRLAALRAPLAYLFGGLGFLCLAPHHFFRYLIPFIPICSFIVAELFWRNFDHGYRAAACAVLAALVFSHGLSISAWNRGGLKSEIFDFVQELSRPIREPVAVAADFLRQNARPGETLLVSYPDLPFMFYTKLRVIGGMSGPHEIRPSKSHWVLLRDDSEKAAWPLDFSKYEKIRLDAPNWPWGNRPDPDLHLFRTATTPEPASIYRRIERL